MNDADHSRAEWERLEQRLSSATWKEALSAVTLGFTHDLNNALTGILGLADTMLLEAKPGDAAHETLTLIKRSTQQAAALVEQLARLHGAKPGKPAYHDLNGVVSQTLEILRRAVPKRIQLESRLSPVMLPVQADALELQHALVSLVLMAARTMSGSGTLVVQTSRQDSPVEGQPKGVARPTPAALLTVRHDGHGTGMGGATGVFTDSFKTDDQALLDFQQARRCAEKCGGTLVLEGTEHSGTTLCLVLPLENVGEPDAPSPANGH
jgi:signal transduction histidine kinase